MREALHIFLKDSRYLRLPIAILVGWLMLFVYASVTTLPLGTFGWRFGGHWYLFLQYSNVGLAVGWTYLIAQAIHADGPRGDRQFWLTRPYTRRNLLLAKTLFVLAYVTLPFALAQAAIIVLMGLPLGSHVPGIAVTQLMWLAVAFLPVAAVATLTSTLPQMLIAALAFPLIVVPLRPFTGLGSASWMGPSVIIVVAGCVAALVVALQVFRRRTKVSWLVALVGILAMHGAATAVTWEQAYGLQARAIAAEALPISSALAEPSANPDRAVALAPAQYRLPFTFDGLAPDTLINCDGMQISLTTSSGERLNAPVRPTNSRTATEASRGCSGIFATSGAFGRFLDAPITIDAVVYVTVFGDPQWTELGVNRPPILIPHAGLCQAVRRENAAAGQFASLSLGFECYRAMRPHDALVTFAETRGGRSFDAPFPDYSPWPGSLVIQPVTRMNAIGANTPGTAWVATRTIRAHARIPVRREGVTLNDYRIRQAR